MLSSNSKERGKWELGGVVLGHAATEQPRWHTQMQPTGKNVHSTVLLQLGGVTVGNDSAQATLEADVLLSPEAGAPQVPSRLG